MVEQQEEKQRKMCPYLNSPCIGLDCEIRVTLQQNLMGVPKTVDVCAETARVLLLSNILAKLPTPMQKMSLPPDLRR